VLRQVEILLRRDGQRVGPAIDQQRGVEADHQGGDPTLVEVRADDDRFVEGADLAPVERQLSAHHGVAAA
jgi:hypothetical protein